MKKLGPQEYLSLLLLFISLFTWIISSIFRLDASTGNTEKAVVEIKGAVNSIDEKTQQIQIDVALIKGKLKEK